MRKTNSRKIRETLASEEKVENENDESENAELEFIKSYGKYFKGVWMEIYKSQSENMHTTVDELAHKVVQLLSFNNQLSEVNIMYFRIIWSLIVLILKT